MASRTFSRLPSKAQSDRIVAASKSCPNGKEKSMFRILDNVQVRGVATHARRHKCQEMPKLFAPIGYVAQPKHDKPARGSCSGGCRRFPKI